MAFIFDAFVCAVKHIEVTEQYKLTFAYGERGLGFAGGDDSSTASATGAELASAGDSVAATTVAFTSVLPSEAGGEGLAGGLRSGGLDDVAVSGGDSVLASTAGASGSATGAAVAVAAAGAAGSATGAAVAVAAAGAAGSATGAAVAVAAAGAAGSATGAAVAVAAAGAAGSATGAAVAVAAADFLPMTKRYFC
uniref:Uncharacterized protein n=1 Tax=Aegilops tauschii TaxID=37682 RepID=R7WFT0_AEGTA